MTGLSNLIHLKYRWVFLFLTLWCGFASSAEWKKGMIEIRPGQKHYVETREAEPGHFTLVEANALTWSTREWQRYVAALDRIDPKLGFVLYDMRGMGRTLLENAPVRQNITLEEQVEDLKALTTKLNIQGPKALVGLSYGGGVTILYTLKHPDDFAHSIAMAPFIERLTDQDQLIELLIAQHRLLFPWDNRAGEQLYDLYLRWFFYSITPLAEPVLLENRYKLEATYRLVQGAGEHNMLNLIRKLPKNKLHLVGAMNDMIVKRDRLQLFWEGIQSEAGSFLRMAHTQHKIPFDEAEMMAHWTYQIITGNPALAQGAVFDGNPFSGEARSGDVVIPLKRTNVLCDPSLRTQPLTPILPAQ